jgi:formylglycine-generating enzyme required for sulfatase activity
VTQIFISYARKDGFFVDRLREDLGRAGINYWIDHEGLSPGTRNWERAIRQAIADSYAVVWVVSPSSYDSEYVSSEIAVAEMHKLKIYPAFADGDNWIACVPLGKHNIQFVDMRGDSYKDGLEKLIEVLAGSLPEIAVPPYVIPVLPDGVEPRNPYKGLSAFTQDDAGDFYGREALVAQLQAHIEDTLTNNLDRFLAVLGASGAGKSSVVMAGLLPALAKAYPQWHILPKIVPGVHPVETLADALYSAMPDKSLSAIETDLQNANGRMLHRLVQQIDAEQVVLYIDQFEELFTLTSDENERQQFINLITQASTEPDGKLIVVLTMRADFYGHPANYPVLGKLINLNSELVLPMTIAELRDAIEKPARSSDVALRFDDGLVAEIVFALRERDKALAGALPLLQFTLERLFTERDGTQLTWQAYNALGDAERGLSGVEGAIGTHCETVFQSLPDDLQAQLGKVFLPLVNIDETTGEATRKRMSMDDLSDDEHVRVFVNTFIDNRLLQTGRDGEEAYLEITHEALFRSWQRLVDWINTAQENLILLRQVKTATSEWLRQGRSDAFRWAHERLEPVYAMVERLQPELSEAEQFFIEPEANRLLRELDTLPKDATSHERRRDIGDRLAVIGDPRLGVGLDSFGLPSIDWKPIEVETLLSFNTKKDGFNSNLNFVDDGEYNIKLRPFYVSKYPITNVQFQSFLTASDGFNDDNSPWWRNMAEDLTLRERVASLIKSDNIPAIVTWFQAVAFGRWLTHRLAGLEFTNPLLKGENLIVGKNVIVRLPTEWEWQWVAQSINSQFSTSEEDLKNGANTIEAGLGRPVAVGLYPQNLSKHGVNDMIGNVYEWCLNKYQFVLDTSVDDSNESRVLRGGAYKFTYSYAKVNLRRFAHPQNLDNYTGFRVVIGSILNEV